MKLKILSYNIHKGFSLKPYDFVLDKIKSTIQQVDADLVFLQEVIGEHVRYETSQFEFLADTLWPHFAYGRNAVYTKGHHGNAILSKYPLEFIENRDISKHRFEQRGILHAKSVLLPENKTLHLYCLHFGLFEKDRRAQAEDLCKMILERKIDQEPFVVAGDFNDWQQTLSKILHEKLQTKDCHFEHHKEHAKTFPSIYPLLKLDRIYTKHLKVLKSSALHGNEWRQLSDHCPLYAEIEV